MGKFGKKPCFFLGVETTCDFFIVFPVIDASDKKLLIRKLLKLFEVAGGWLNRRWQVWSAAENDGIFTNHGPTKAKSAHQFKIV